MEKIDINLEVVGDVAKEKQNEDEKSNRLWETALVPLASGENRTNALGNGPRSNMSANMSANAIATANRDDGILVAPAKDAKHRRQGFSSVEEFAFFTPIDQY